jgi:hypothetical protein
MSGNREWSDHSGGAHKGHIPQERPAIGLPPARGIAATFGSADGPPERFQDVRASSRVLQHPPVPQAF